jgi:hypothetical protein
LHAAAVRLLDVDPDARPQLDLLLEIDEDVTHEEARVDDARPQRGDDPAVHVVQADRRANDSVVVASLRHRHALLCRKPAN